MKKGDYEDHGSVEGRLEATLSLRTGILEFAIRETVWGKLIECRIVESLEPKALLNAEKRVEIYGPIRYGKDETPLSVSAEEIIPFPDPCDIPSCEDVKGMLAAYE